MDDRMTNPTKVLLDADSGHSDSINVTTLPSKVVIGESPGSGSSSGGVSLGETATTAYRGDRGKVAYDHSQEEGNPHNTTAEEVGAATSSDISSAISDHEAGDDPHGDRAYAGALTLASIATEVSARNAAITSAINNLVDGAPAALDTLNELATRLESEAAELDALVGTVASKETPTGAQYKADAAQAFAVQRTNHTGFQSISTVTGLQASLDGKVPTTRMVNGLDLSSDRTLPNNLWSHQFIAWLTWKAYGGTAPSRSLSNSRLTCGYLNFPTVGTGHWVEWSVGLDAGVWDLTLIYDKLTIYGTYDVSIDGVVVGSFNANGASATNQVLLINGITVVSNGTHTLRLTNTGNGAGANTAGLALEAFGFQRTA